MHFGDDWEEADDRWDEMYSDAKEVAPEGTAKHRRKFGVLEDGYNNRWQDMVYFGRCMTADES